MPMQCQLAKHINLSYIPNLYNRKLILLVEGQSEKAFLDKLKESHNSWFTDLRTEVYAGNGNAHPRRIQMRLEKYVEDGVLLAYSPVENRIFRFKEFSS